MDCPKCGGYCVPETDDVPYSFSPEGIGYREVLAAVICDDCGYELEEDELEEFEDYLASEAEDNKLEIALERAERSRDEERYGD